MIAKIILKQILDKEFGFSPIFTELCRRKILESCKEATNSRFFYNYSINENEPSFH